MIVAMKHEKRRLLSRSISSPVPDSAGRDTRASGLLTGGMFRVVTDLAVFGFDDEKRRMQVMSLNPGVSREQVQDNTGFPSPGFRGQSSA